MKRFSIPKILGGAAALLLIISTGIPVLSANARPLYEAALAPAPFGTDAREYEAEYTLSLEEVRAGAGSDDEFIPHVWPVRFSEVGYISSYFGTRIDPVTGEGSEFHAGVDMADQRYTKIHAAASGTVVEAEYFGGYGQTILIDHGNGYTSRYNHCETLLVSVGDTVSQGQVIATMGATGRVTGVHLDFRIYVDGAAVNPLSVLDPQED